jgi:colicin import membrane protein
MQAATDRLEFAPPQQPGFLRSVILAVLAHLLLLAALTWGVHWKRESENLSVEAELWSAVPQQAAPKAAEAPPPPPPPPPARAETPPPPPVTKDADIALEREKKRRELEKQREAEKEKQRALEEKQEQERKKKADAEKKKQQEAREKAQAEKERQEKKELEAKRKAEADARREKEQKEADAKRQEERRQENIRRMQGLAGASGGPNASGTALQSSGPSASYAGRVAGAVKPNIVYPDAVQGNPRVIVQVRNAPDGTIVGRKIVESSGNKAWDEAILRALDKTDKMPRDSDGRVPPQFEIGFRPKD